MSAFTFWALAGVPPYNVSSVLILCFYVKATLLTEESTLAPAASIGRLTTGRLVIPKEESAPLPSALSRIHLTSAQGDGSRTSEYTTC
jgi:hypothetical protein